ncbi:OsmC family protein [Isoptericola sp. b441]|uniref:OsmC family protein n=1 Tax=Actinotalea lenta TaxID=3064654 RepID=A0ABT9DEL2_9CELL|nr:OsmC family protein [Isoptericola sp. b441]MDO8107863.1 OsmC family protein [Isoptericola sp. b441]
MSTTTPEHELTRIVESTGQAIDRDVAAARLTVLVTGRSTAGVATDLSARAHTWRVDEPAALGGQDAAANPVEAALGAFLACQTVTYRFWAARLGIRLDDVRLEAEADLDVRGFFGLDESTRPGFGALRVRVRLVGPETAERYAELQAAVDAHCPVLDLFANPTPVTTTLITD